jgi:excisionase family DNA binding protein
MLTLGQAAKETGLSKPTISKAIKTGRLSAVKAENGEYQIDPAELFRVYPVASKPKRETLHEETHGLQPTLDTMRELLRQVEGERDDLRRRLDEEAADRRASAEEVRRLTLLISHNPANQNAASDLAKPEARPAVRGWLWFALAVAMAAAVGYAWLYGLLHVQ